MQKEKIKNMQRDVRAHYSALGRHSLPWRQTQDPYAILVSEMMLQQTQVPRVIPKYEAFLKRFPTVEALARASLAEVLSLWSGLGYNRRAKYLHQSAVYCVQVYGGVFPREIKLLESFPGIGPYTARAVAVFAYDTPIALIETNVRTVLLHYFFPRKKAVSDSVLLKLATSALDVNAPRVWTAALMDYGSYLKSKGVKTHRKSAAYKKQPAFKGSRRAVRGALIKALLAGVRTVASIKKEFGTEGISVVEDLVKEGLVKKTKQSVSIVS